MHWLEHRVPPPLVAALIGVAMWFGFRVTGAMAVGPTLRIVLTALLVLGGSALALTGIVHFRRARTTIDPHTPADASALVVVGVYRFTRNPMYLGVALLLLAWAVYLAAPVAVLGPLLFVIYINRFQIQPEERVLAQKFGSAYSSYCRRVRRWL